ncbi:hypothetical protein [Corallococcus llansteffanensis]|uniref:Uncharacterized protein n=1 Tax=Corallococcus llansteffanensis TaxID=2316731 RepID=A0A3A8NGZ2_9BACT|nr:hypothetical protein [Corallococcus llansteffanensis]RKH41451.1 hypothetical protein D7V93_38730 [Corallococcus llansteffanensis]
MRFAYHQRLSVAEQRVYRQGDAVTKVPLRRPATPRPWVEGVRESSLFQQRVPPAGAPKRREAADTGKWSTSTRRGGR